MEKKYTPEEIEDITNREKECLAFLVEKQMTPSAVVQKVNVGNDVFADKVIPYLADLKYKPEPKKEDVAA